MYRKETNTIRFFYKRDALFNDVSMLSNFMAKNLATKEGVSLTEEFALSPDEKDLFDVCVKQSLPDVYEQMIKITSGVTESFGEWAFAKSVAVAQGGSKDGLYDGDTEPDQTHVNLYYLEDEGIIYLEATPESGTAATELTLYDIVESISFLIRDNAAYNDNVLTIVDSSIENCVKYGALKEFYSTIVQADLLKIAANRYVEEMNKLAQRLFQLKKKSRVF